MRLKCLSIQQPWADLILSGRKRVENRAWRIGVAAVEGRPGELLGIHASKKGDTMRALPEEELDDYVPGWREEGVLVGCVLGVVDLVRICRSRDLPPDLRDREFADDDPGNWCWVLANPRPLKEPFE